MKYLVLTFFIIAGILYANNAPNALDRTVIKHDLSTFEEIDHAR